MRTLRFGSLLLVLCLVAAACSGAKKAEDTGALKTDASTTTTAAGGDPGSTVPGAPTTIATPGASVTTKPGAATPKGSTKQASGGGKVEGGIAPAPPVAEPQLFAGALNTRGITDTEVKLCAHAALTYGPAFNASADDFNVYFSAINDAGGVHGRKITATYENDDYSPTTAIQAADACKAKGPFMIGGGIGFDQIPSVRNWAETNKELYMHHIATVKGSEGKKYSYTTQPTVEAVGRAFGELAAARLRTKKFGVLYRNSEFWQPGFDAFKKVAAEKGITIVRAIGVEKNQANYTQALVELKGAGAEVVFGWENTLALTQMVKQAKAQAYSPIWLAFPFNLTAQTLADDAMTPPMIGLASWPGYSKGDYSGVAASYAADMKEFEAQYAKYRPNTDIGGVAGDLLWLNWVEQKRFVNMMRLCGRDCTRNRFVGLLAAGYKATTSPACPLDFSGGKHDGSGGLLDVMETYRSPSGKVNWHSTAHCRSHDFKP